jgi:hypothetical protein
MKRHLIFICFVFLSMFFIGCYHLANRSKEYDRDCSLTIELSNTVFGTWIDVKFEFVYDFDQLYVTRTPFFGVAVRKVNEPPRTLTELHKLKRRHLDMTPQHGNKLPVNSWDNVSRQEAAWGGTITNTVDPGKYYIEVVYCTSRSCRPEDLCVYTSEPFEILVEYGYGGIIEREIK